MAYKFTFADNEIYSASDVNEITKRLVTSGIEDSFTDGVAYNVSKFNEAGKLLYTSGVVPENCLTLKVNKVSDTEILINPGKAFFNDGAVIEIEAGGETLPYVKGAKNYVYLKNELVDKNICYPVCTTEAPTGDYVLLAEIDESGEIADKRTYAKGKLPGYQSVAGNVMRIQEYIELTDSLGNSTYSGSKTFDIGNNNYEYILTYIKRSDYTLECLGIYNISEQSYLSFKHLDTFYNTSQISLESLFIKNSLGDSSHAEVTFVLDSGKLTATVTAYKRESSYVGTLFPIDLILF